jgi:hypothetical protein
MALPPTSCAACVRVVPASGGVVPTFETILHEVGLISTGSTQVSDPAISCAPTRQCAHSVRMVAAQMLVDARRALNACTYPPELYDGELVFEIEVDPPIYERDELLSAESALNLAGMKVVRSLNVNAQVRGG